MKTTSNYVKWSLLLFVSIVWGVSFFVREKSLVTYSELQITFLQIFITFLFFIPFIIKSFKKISKKNIKILIISAVIGNAMTSLFFSLGQAKINSSLAGILSSLIPILTLVTSILFFKYRSSDNWRNWVGIMIGFAGVVLIILAGKGGGTNYLSGVLFIFLAALFASLNINIICFLIKNLNGLEIAAISFLIIGPPSGIIAFFITDVGLILEHEYFISSTWMLITISFIVFIGAISYNVLIKISTHIFSSFAAYLIPVVAIIIGFFLGKEQLNLLHFISICCIFTGIFLTQTPQKYR